MLRIEEVFKSYKTSNVLKGVSFNVKRGEIKGLIGVNGAGKSTLIEIICGVKKADGGEVFVNGIDIRDKKKQKDIKSLIGYMPQSFSLFSDLTVKENLGYLCGVYGIKDKKRVDELLKICKLEDKKNMLAQNLSGGYRQLLSVAGALIHDPQLLILDEPTSAMDPLFRRSFWQIIKDCKENGKTVLLITHHMEELNECDSFVCLDNGVVAVNKNIKDKTQFINIESVLKNARGGKWNQ